MSERLKDLQAKLDRAMKEGDQEKTIELGAEIKKLKDELASADEKTTATITLPSHLVKRAIQEAEALGFKKGSYGPIVARGLARYFTTKMGYEESILSSHGEALFKKFLAEKNPDEAMQILNHLSEEDLQSIEILLESAVLSKSEPVVVELPLKEARRLCEIVKRAGEARTKA